MSETNQNNAQKVLYTAFVIFIILAIVLGIWAAIAYGTTDAAYLAKAVEYPRTYPLDEAPVTPNIFLGFAVLSFFGFAAFVVYGLSAIVGSLNPSEKEPPKFKGDTSSPTVVCRVCGGSYPVGEDVCWHCGAKTPTEKSEATVIPSDTAVCQSCHGLYPVGDTHCWQCGNKTPFAASGVIENGK
jgi:ribosomal protein L40E